MYSGKCHFLYCHLLTCFKVIFHNFVLRVHVLYFLNVLRPAEFGSKKEKIPRRAFNTSSNLKHENRCNLNIYIFCNPDLLTVYKINMISEAQQLFLNAKNRILLLCSFLSFLEKRLSFHDFYRCQSTYR